MKKCLLPAGFHLEGKLDPQKENNYRANSLRADTHQAVAAIALSFIAISLFAVNDFTLFGSTPIFWCLLALRISVLICGILLILYLRRQSDWKKYDLTIMAWGLLAVACAIFINYSRLPDRFATHIDVLIIMMIFMGIPFKLEFRAILATIFTAACIIMLLAGSLNQDLSHRFSAVSALILANGGGLALSHIVYSFKRQQYLLKIADVKNREELTRLASEDSLTGICNRRAFFDLADKELARFQRYGSSFSLLIMDMDNFKQINDTFGHAAGDVILKCFTSVINSQIRKTDIFGRIGGDEFALVLAETPFESAAEIADRIRSSCSQISLPQSGTEISVSIGIAVPAQSDKSIDQVIARADSAMYSYKRSAPTNTNAQSA